LATFGRRIYFTIPSDDCALQYSLSICRRAVFRAYSGLGRGRIRRTPSPGRRTQDLLSWPAS